VYSDPDQPARFAEQKRVNNQRALNIDSVYEGKKFNDKVCLVTGSNRGLGKAICEELVAQGARVIATCRKSEPKIEGLYKVIKGIDVMDNKSMEKLVKEIGEDSVDVVVNNAGYFMVDPETIEGNKCDFSEELKMIDICAVGPLRVTSALFNGKKLSKGAKIAMITSQGGSITWRAVQNCGGPYDYGHHMSKAAANMMGRLVAMEMKSHGIIVQILHPGFNRTDMTSKYKHIWDIEGAVDSSVGAKRVCHEINLMTLERAGMFINCEDGLQIPW